MSDWFEFGAVRGIIGAIVGIPIALLIFHTTKNPLVAQAMPMSTTICHTTDIAILVFGAVIGIIVSGIIFEIGAWVCRKLDVRPSGVWAPIAVGVIGSLVVAIVASIILSAILLPVNPILASAMLGGVLLALPISLITEAGYDAITYAVYKYMNWPVPQL